MTAEERFKKAVREAAQDRTVVPTPMRVLRIYAPQRAKSRRQGGPMLNGRESHWRQEVLAELGYRKHILTGRYFLPADVDPWPDPLKMLQEPGVTGRINLDLNPSGVMIT